MHDPHCTGCPICSAEMRALLSMTVEERCHWLTAQDAKRGLRTATERHVAADDSGDYRAPNSYAPDLAALRAAASTDASRFEEQFKANRLRDLNAEHARHDAALAAQPSSRLTTAQLADYAPPDPYAAALAALRESRR